MSFDCGISGDIHASDTTVLVAWFGVDPVGQSGLREIRGWRLQQANDSGTARCAAVFHQANATPINLIVHQATATICQSIQPAKHISRRCAALGG
jgi:hypothetical protein